VSPSRALASQVAPPVPESDWEPVSAPDISHLITEDDEPVDSIFSEKQRRLLTEPLYSSWSGPPPEQDGAPRPFMALANVGFFSMPENNPLVPDVLLSADVRMGDDLTRKENHSYFQWKDGKAPDVVIEVVSNAKGGELGERFHRYCRAGVPYYVVYDPLHCLGEPTLHAFQRTGTQYQRMDAPRFESLGLALTEWRGTFESHADTWLRWSTLDGKLIPTGAERAEEERKRAEEATTRAEDERKRAEEATTRAEDERKRAEEATTRAEDERKRAEEATSRAAQAEERVRRLEELLRGQGKG
jgi:hypothetical protein